LLTMGYGKRKLPASTVKLRKLYVTDHLTLGQISERYGVHKSYVHAELQKRGITAREALHFPVNCSYDGCGKEFSIERNLARRQDIDKFSNYCSQKCYQKSRDTGFSRKKRTTIASRRIVGNYFEGFKKKMIVHHVDNNSANLMISNLWVFKNISDHSKYHHRIRINKSRLKKDHVKVPEPVWKGPVTD